VRADWRIFGFAVSNLGLQDVLGREIFLPWEFGGAYGSFDFFYICFSGPLFPYAFLSSERFRVIRYAILDCVPLLVGCLLDACWMPIGACNPTFFDISDIFRYFLG